MDIFMASFPPHLFVSIYQTQQGMVTSLILHQHLRIVINFQKMVSLSKCFFNTSKPEDCYLWVYTQQYTIGLAVFVVIETNTLTDYNAPIDIWAKYGCGKLAICIHITTPLDKKQNNPPPSFLLLCVSAEPTTIYPINSYNFHNMINIEEEKVSPITCYLPPYLLQFPTCANTT